MAPPSSSSTHEPPLSRSRQTCIWRYAPAPISRSHWRSTVIFSRKAWPTRRFSPSTPPEPTGCAKRARPWTFERAAAEADVAASAIRTVAERYAAEAPALIRCGWGQERNRNGGNASLAILALPAVAGKFGVRGGGYASSNAGAWDITRTWIREAEPDTRIVNMNHLGRVLTDDADSPVKVLFVYNNNAVATTPHQRLVLKGLEREDLFTVVFDQVMTDTARYADVLLPVTTFLEAYDIAKAYGPISLRLTQPVIDAVGEARSNADVFGDLLSRFGLQRDAEPRGELEEMLDVMTQLPDDIKKGLGERVPPPHRSRDARSSSATSGLVRLTARPTCSPKTSTWKHPRVCTDTSPIRRRRSSRSR